jgi:DNA repair exonuclease SbcCD ATPase subunit
MINLKKLFATTAATAAELRQALGEIDVTAAQQAVDALEAERSKLLLTGSDDDLGSVEQRLGAAAVRLERAHAQTRELQRRVDEADAAENRAAIDRERDRAEAEAAACAAELKRSYPKLATQLVGLLRRLHAAEEAVTKVNRALYETGRLTESLSPVEPRALPVAPNLYAPAYSVLKHTQLRELDGVAPGWPERL